MTNIFDRLLWQDSGSCRQEVDVKCHETLVLLLLTLLLNILISNIKSIIERNLLWDKEYTLWTVWSTQELVIVTKLEKWKRIPHRSMMVLLSIFVNALYNWEFLLGFQMIKLKFMGLIVGLERKDFDKL